ncbi:hypothetical protein, partial [Vibrio fluvialis]|uniref:hypothetical protein n=1 Tax=Vibrio fluvialis TaxID=676 RepID=UPI0023AF5B28
LRKRLMLITLLSLPNSVGANSRQWGREMKKAKLTMCVRKTFEVEHSERDLPGDFRQPDLRVIRDQPQERAQL